MVSHDGGGIIQEVAYLVVILAIRDDLLQQVDIVSPACFDQLLFDGGALSCAVSLLCVKMSINQGCKGA